MSGVLIIGYGNPLRGDDGLGWRAAEALRGSAAEVRTVHQLTPELAEPVSRAQLVVFIDAGCDHSEGTIVFRRLAADASPPRMFSHEFTPEVVLSLARKLYGRSPEAALFSVGGASFDCGDELSEAVQSAVPDLLAQVQKIIHQRGILHEETEESRR